MTYALTPDEIKISREHLVYGPQQDLNSHVGAYLIWYSIVEAFITIMLAKLSDQNDMNRFEIISKGMDARVKIERIRTLANHYAVMGPNLKARFAHFEDKHVRLRNLLAHTWPVLGEDGQTVRLGVRGERKLELPVKTTTLDSIVEMIVWLHDFHGDLETSLHSLHDGKEFEVDAPKSSLPSTPAPPPKAPPSTQNSRARKRARKAAAGA